MAPLLWSGGGGTKPFSKRLLLNLGSNPFRLKLFRSCFYTILVSLQRHLIHSLATPVLAVVATGPFWLTSEALRASRALCPPPPRRMAAPSGAPSEARVPDSCGGES